MLNSVIVFINLDSGISNFLARSFKFPEIAGFELLYLGSKRLKDLEEMAIAEKGVSNAYAIQAGRELRVIVSSDKVSDEESKKISYNISQRIQSEMTYPGQVKVTVIRETRSVNIAK